MVLVFVFAIANRQTFNPRGTKSSTVPVPYGSLPRTMRTRPLRHLGIQVLTRIKLNHKHEYQSSSSITSPRLEFRFPVFSSAIRQQHCCLQGARNSTHSPSPAEFLAAIGPKVRTKYVYRRGLSHTILLPADDRLPRGDRLGLTNL